MSGALTESDKALRFWHRSLMAASIAVLSFALLPRPLIMDQIDAANEALSLIRDFTYQSQNQRQLGIPAYETLGTKGEFVPSFAREPYVDFEGILAESSGGTATNGVTHPITGILEKTFSDAIAPYAELPIDANASLEELKRKLGVRLVIEPTSIGMLWLHEIAFEFNPPTSISFLARITDDGDPVLGGILDTDGEDTIRSVCNEHQQALALLRDGFDSYLARHEKAGTYKSETISNAEYGLIAFNDESSWGQLSGVARVRREPRVDLAFLELTPLWERLRNKTIDLAEAELRHMGTEAEKSISVIGFEFSEGTLAVIGAPMLMCLCMLTKLYLARSWRADESELPAAWFPLFESLDASILTFGSLLLPVGASIYLLCLAPTRASAACIFVVVCITARQSMLIWRSLHTWKRDIKEVSAS